MLILPAPRLDLCFHRNAYTSLCFCNGTSVLMNCSAAIYPLITPMTHIKVTIFHRNKHKQNRHHSNCLYSETHSVLWVLRVASLGGCFTFWVLRFARVRGTRRTGHLLRDGEEGLQPVWGRGPLSTL